MCFFKKKKQREAAAKQEAIKKEQEAKEKVAQEKAAKEKAAFEQAAKEKAAFEQAVKERAAFEQAVKERAALEQAAKEQAALEQAAKEQAALEQTAKEKAAQEQLAKDNEVTKVKAKSPKAATKESAPASDKNTTEETEATAKKKTLTGKVEIFLDKQDCFRFRIKASNGQIVARSESYGSKAACKKGFSSIQNYESIDIMDITDVNTTYLPKIGAPVFEIYVDNAQLFRFRYRSGNAVAVLFSKQGYSSKASCVKAVSSVIKNSCNYEIIDITKEKVEDEE